MIQMTFRSYHSNLDRALQGIEADSNGTKIDIETAVRSVHALMRGTRAERKTVWFCGNGGSSAIATHMAADYHKAGLLRTCCLADSPARLTAIGNDLSFDQIFSYQITELNGCSEWDVLVAISSSGNSRDILNAVEAAQALNMSVVTLSGFRPDNSLRRLGNINFYVPSQQYGIVELSHHVILHMMLDTLNGE